MRGWLLVTIGCAPGSGIDGTTPPAPPGPPSTPTETSFTPTERPGLAVINEILADGLAGDASCDGIIDPAGDTFVEVVNVGDAALDLSGAVLRVDGEARHLFRAGLVLPPLGTAVLYGGPGARLDGTGVSGPWCAAVPPTVFVESGASLALSGSVTLDDAEGHRLATFPVASDVFGRSTNRNPDLSDTVPVPHDEVPGATSLFSPGRSVLGTAFAGEIVDPPDTGDTGDPTDTGETLPTTDTGPTGPVQASIYDVQDGTIATGTEVIVSGVVVTAVATDGVMVEESPGGPYSGVFLALGVGWEAVYGALDRGDQVDVTGMTVEIAGYTAIDPAASLVGALTLTGTAPEPPPTLVGAAALAADPDPYDGVLVEVAQGVVHATPVANDIEIRDPNGTVSVYVDDRLWLFSGIGGLVPGDRLLYARGVVFGAAVGTPRVSVRSDEDLAQIDLALRINEVLGDPDGVLGDANCDGDVDGVEDDFVEIWNLGGDPVDLGGMTLSDLTTTRHTFAGGTVLAPGGGVVVFGGGTPTFAGGVSGTWCAALPANVIVTTSTTNSLGITNSGDTLSLVSQTVAADQVTFGPEAAGDVSINRNPELSSGALTAHDTVSGATNGWSPGTFVDDVPGPYRATIAIDGDPGDFPTDSLFTSSAGTTVNVAWDRDQLYVAIEHPAIGLGPEQSVVIYAGDGGGAGAATGLAIGSQQPNLPFLATRAVKWTTDGSSDLLASWNTGSGTWDLAPGWLSANGAVADDDVAEVVELSIPLAALDTYTVLEFALMIVDNTGGAEQSVCALPSGAFADGSLDPDIAQYYAFHPQLDPAPSSYEPLP